MLILFAIIAVVIIVVVVVTIIIVKKKKNNTGTVDNSPGTAEATAPEASGVETFYKTNATEKFADFINSYIKGEQGIF